MSDIDLTLAINHYDHVQDMATGAVKAEGINLTVINHGPEEIFHRGGGDLYDSIRFQLGPEV